MPPVSYLQSKINFLRKKKLSPDTAAVDSLVNEHYKPLPPATKNLRKIDREVFPRP